MTSVYAESTAPAKDTPSTPAHMKFSPWTTEKAGRLYISPVSFVTSSEMNAASALRATESRSFTGSVWSSRHRGSFAGVAGWSGWSGFSFRQFPSQLGRQSMQEHPNLWQTQFLQRPLLLHRQNQGIARIFSQNLKKNQLTLGSLSFFISLADFATCRYRFPIKHFQQLVRSAQFWDVHKCHYTYVLDRQLLTKRLQKYSTYLNWCLGVQSNIKGEKVTEKL